MVGKRITYGLLLLLILVAIVALFGVFYNPPESYTTLYFSDSLNLAKEVRVNEPFHVDFTIENHEQKRTSYEYVLSLVYYKDQTIVKEIDIKREKLSLDDNDKRSISEVIVVDEPFDGRVKVSVELFKEGISEPYRGLWYWVEVQ